MLQALGETLQEMLGSKKFLMLLATVIATISAKIGWNITVEQLTPWIGLAASAILAQGIADHGKGKAEVEAKTVLALRNCDPNAVTVEKVITKEEKLPDAGFAEIHVMILVALVCLFTVAACSWWSSKGESTTVDCGKGELSKLEGVAIALAPAIVSGSLKLDDVEMAAEKAGFDFGGCLLAHLADQLKPAQGFAGEPPAHKALRTFRTNLGKGGSFHTAHGDH